MTENAFKNIISPKVARALGKNLHSVDESFDLVRFKKQATKNLEALELKARVEQVADAIVENATSFQSAVAAIEGFFETHEEPGTEGVSAGMIYWPYMSVIERHGLDEFDLSMRAMHHITRYFSAEFAIRPFLEADRDRVEAYLKKWRTDSSPHVRRLVSEGSRPLLPWGIRLNEIKDDPKWSVQLLEPLKDDPEEYVRRSVANHLNDVSKHHPSIVIRTAKAWLKDADDHRTKLVRHALRTLFKKGDKGALTVFGFKKPKFTLVDFDVSEKATAKTACEFSVEIDADATGKWMVDYVIHYVKANGKTSPKVFKWFTADVKKGARVSREKSQSFKSVSTRKHYPGVHAVEVVINGESVGTREFTFK